MRKKQKGQYGYLTTNRRFYLTCSIGCAVVVVLLVGIGYALFSTKLNMLMIPAMLCVIPTANYIVNYLAIVMFDSAPAEQYETVRAFDEAGLLLSDLVLVDEKGGRNHLSFAVIYKNGVIGYQFGKKDTRAMIEVTVNDIMKRRGIPMRIKVYRSWDDFVKRIQDVEMPENEEICERIRRGKEAILSTSL